MALFLPTPGIALIELYGSIGGAVRPAVYVPLLERARKSRSLRALTLAIDSPGGGAAASEELYQAVSKVAKVKPVVACIRERGASGAYYISCGARKIIAVPNALVGSIGVIFLRPIAEQLLQKIGLDVSIHKSGKYKDMFGPWRKSTPEEDEKVQALMGDMYERFVRVVAEGRKLDLARVKELATGEVFTAQKAKELNLIDDLGDLDSAIELAAQMAGMKRRRVVNLRPRRPFMRRVFGGIAEDLVQATMEEVEARMLGRAQF